MKKVLFIVYAMNGGVGNVVTLLVNSLTKYFDVSLLEIFHFSTCRYNFNPSVKFLGSIIDKETEPKYKRDFKVFCIENNMELLRAAYDLNEYDIVISCDYMLPSYLLRAFPDKPCINWVHTTLLRLSGKNNHLLFTAQKKVWQDAYSVNLVSNAEYRIMQNIMPEYLHKTKIIYNPFDAEYVIKKSKEYCDFNFAQYDFPFVCCIGRVDKNKNFKLAILSIKYLKEDNIKCGLLIIGSGSEENNLKKMVKDLHLSNQVFFLGESKNPYTYLSRCLCLCITSLQETWGMVACEAMALGKPFITTPVSGASEELVLDGKCGIITPYNDIADYADKIKMLMKNKTMYMEMSKNCIKHANTFTTENAVIEWISLINGADDNNKIRVSCEKELALKKLKTLFVWDWQQVLSYSKNSLLNFCANKTIKNFIKFLYYNTIAYAIYICHTPIRFMEKNILFGILRK